MQEKQREYEIKTRGISERIEKMLESGQYTEDSNGWYTLIDPKTGSKILLIASSVEEYKKKKSS